MLTARRTEVLEPLAADLGARVVACDLSQREDVERLISEAGRVDVLIANAALPASGFLLELTPPEIDRMLEVNLRAPIALARAFAPGMAERRRGHLVFISSLSGKGRVAGVLGLFGDEVRAAGVCARPPRGPAPPRRGRLGDPARLHPRGRDVRGLAG